jgi:SAM-dependent methyltransferase
VGHELCREFAVISNCSSYHAGPRDGPAHRYNRGVSTIDAAAFHDFERNGWERAAEYYAAAFGEITGQIAAPLLDAVRAGQGTRVLDVATGPGFVAAAAAKRGAIVTGLDFSPAMIAAARTRHPGITFRDGDAEALPFDDASFDAVVMNFGLLHLARPERAIAEAHRVLRPGGRYAFTVWAPPDRAVGFGMVLKAIETFGRTDVSLPEGPPFFRFSAIDESQQTLGRAGFVDAEAHVVPLKWALDSADGVFEALSRGGVRTAAVLRAQTPEALAAIRASVRNSVERYKDGDRFVLPMPAVLASAIKPHS